jgi:two-component system, NtrC family, response regulator AtoC
MNKSLLIIDDDQLLRSFLATVLKSEGYAIDEAGTGKEGLEKLAAADFSLVVTDLRMPDMSGLDVIREGKKVRPEARWIIITAYGTIASAVEAMKEGASDYLTKPLSSPDELRRVVKRLFKEMETEQRLSFLSEELGRQYPPPEMIFLGKEMEQTRELVHNVAPTSATVLITGPSGTGKELIARVVHQLSPRKEGPFVAVHCAALAESLLESELFGHEKGAFTGAIGIRKGRFEQADGGTIFLDEVGEISASVQVKILRVLQEKEFERVGGIRPLSVDIRIISATNKNLKEEIGAGRFREDLYYRLNVFPLAIPPLAERPEAIIPLAKYFVTKFSAVLGRRQARLTEEASSRLIQYPWPGNIRELQNVIERAVILSTDRIGPESLNLEEPRKQGTPGDGMIRSAEREVIEKALREAGGNRRKAALMLGISLRTLQYRIKEYGLE